MSFRYSLLCGTASDTVDAVKWKILKFKVAEYLKNIIKLTISKILNAQFRIKLVGVCLHRKILDRIH